jgi:hypothetical protein
VRADIRGGRVWADIVAKLFLVPERETMIQNHAQMRNVDSRTLSSRFDCYKIRFHSVRSATFATISANRRLRRPLRWVLDLRQPAVESRDDA